MLGLEIFLKKDYKKLKKYFERLNKVSGNNLFFKDFIGNVLIWLGAKRPNKTIKKIVLQILNKIPDRYYNIKKTQNIFLQCYFDSNQV